MPKNRNTKWRRKRVCTQVRTDLMRHVFDQVGNHIKDQIRRQGYASIAFQIQTQVDAQLKKDLEDHISVVVGTA